MFIYRVETSSHYLVSGLLSLLLLLLHSLEGSAAHLRERILMERELTICIKKKGGLIRKIKSSQKCHGDENRRTIQNYGTKGDTGPKGDAGQSCLLSPGSSDSTKTLSCGTNNMEIMSGSDLANQILALQKTMSQLSALHKNIVFITSTNFQGNFGGIAKANTECNKVATAAGLPGTYAAWLSTTKTGESMKERKLTGEFQNQNRRYALVDGSIVSNSFDGFFLTDTVPLVNTITLNENGETKSADSRRLLGSRQLPSNGAFVWTGTQNSGDASTDDCDGWTTLSQTVAGLYGENFYHSEWTDYNEDDCSEAHAFYCFQSSDDAPPS